MKLINLLEERITGEKHLVMTIQRDCQQFLEEIGDPTEHLLVRGFYPSFRMNKLLGDNVLEGKVRKDRRPTDTPEEISKMLDNWFESKFNVRYRAESLFCVGSKDLARKYGKTYVIFPKGSFTYCWSPVFGDLFNENADAFSVHNTDLSQKVVDEILDSGEYQTKNIVEAISKYPKNEIMIDCDSYYALDYYYFNSHFVPAWEAFGK